MTNISNSTLSNKQQLAEQKQIQATQSWYAPSLEVLEKMLDKRRANLRKRNGDEKQAAVTRDEFIEHLHDLKGMNLWQASEVVASLKRAGKIKCFGRFIQMGDQDGEQ
ncbi:hypothetical protein F892_01686 [Acinetobacter vivianii]|uniref:Uncharacterized protein n=1 Tax=Acinetobacter vivianii TaxID=1776742 RepID=N9NMZ0_9GAMM|nr:hypothetical protein [Acinetobacter vivianii]ENX22444.1 hypothetical protein F892_01686 [Acinetobacter vivianii]GGI58813.1 hypothetical protein GCM10011446_03080 [Acinetobacter vivianii]